MIHYFEFSSAAYTNTCIQGQLILFLGLNGILMLLAINYAANVKPKAEIEFFIHVSCNNEWDRF